MSVIVVSASEFPTFVPDPATAVLRIYDPVDDWRRDAGHQATLGWGRFLPLDFWDAGRFGPSWIERMLVAVFGHNRRLCLGLARRLFGDAVPWRPFLPADADDIVRFADGLATGGIRDVVVVCGNGRARSWTVACWIARHLGLEKPLARGWQRSCPHIARMLDRTGSKPHVGNEPMPTRPAFSH